MESSQLINSQASSLELKLNSMIEELRQSSGEIKDTQYHNKQIRETFNQLRAKIKSLESHIRESKTDDEREQVKKMVEWHSSQINELQKTLQRSNLMLKRVQDDRVRDELLNSSTKESTRLRKKEDSSVQATSAITESLVELRQQLATGLKSSEETLKTLVHSSNVLSDSHTEMKTVGSHIDISTRLISKFGRREIVDKLLIIGGLVLFFSVVLYILKKRLIG